MSDFDWASAAQPAEPEQSDQAAQPEAAGAFDWSNADKPAESTSPLAPIDAEAQPVPAVNPYLAVAQRMKQAEDKQREQAAGLMRWRSEHTFIAPDKQAEVLRYSAASGLSPDLVERNLEDVRKQVDSKAVNWDALAKDSPGLAGYLLNKPEAYPVVNDDVAKLSGMEGWLTGKWVADTVDVGSPIPGGPSIPLPYPRLAVPPKWAAALNDAVAQERLNYYGAKKAVGLGNAADEAAAGAIKADNPRREVVDPDGSLASRIVGNAFLAPFKMAPYVAGNAAAATLGLPGVLAFNTYEALGPAQEAIDGVTGPNGEKPGSATSKALVLGTAVAGGALFTFGMGPIMKGLGVAAKPFVEDAGGAALKAVLAQPSVKKSIGNAAMKWGGHVALGAASMASQAAIQDAATQVAAKSAYGKSFDWNETGAAWSQSFGQGLQDMLLMGAVGPAREFFAERGRAIASAESTQRLEQLVSDAKDSKTLGRSPEVFNEAVSKMAEQEGASKAIYHPVEEWSRYWQEKKVDPEKVAATVMGDDGKAYREAVATGGDLAIPVADYLSKLGKTEHIDGLAEDRKLNPDELTPRQQNEEATRIRERLTLEGKTRGSEIEQGKKSVYDVIRQQAESAGIAKKDADANAKLISEFAGTAALRMGVSVQEAARIAGLGQLRILGPKGEAAAEGVRAEFQKFLSAPSDSRMLAERASSLSVENRAREKYVDYVSGLRTRKAFDLLPVPEGKRVGVITITRAKPLNDHPDGGHDTTNELLRVVGKAAGEVVPEAARSGTSILFHGDEATLKAVTEKVNSVVPHEEFHVDGALGDSTDTAFKTLDAQVEAKREAGLLPKRDAPLNEAVNVKGLKFPEGKAPTTLPDELLHSVDVHPKEYFEQTYLDHAKDGTPTGLLSAEGERALPPLAHTLAMDLTGVKATNTKYGEGVGDQLLFRFAKVVSHLGGSSFRATHRSGDEYSAGHDDPTRLLEFAKRLKEELKKHTLDVEDPDTGKIVRLPIDFRYGIGSSYGKADKDLNVGKRRERAAAPQDPGGTGGVPQEVQGAGNQLPGPENLGARDVQGGLGQTASGGPGQIGPRTSGEGAAPQHFPGSSGKDFQVAHIEGQPVTFDQAAYHGSPHRFEQFSLHKIGTGEGNQSYGWGLYFAGSKAVAEHYREALSTRPALEGGAFRKELTQRMLERVGELEGEGRTKDAARLRRQAEDTATSEVAAGKDGAQLAKYHADKDGVNIDGLVQRDQGQTYKVDVPDDHELLDHDKPLSKQSAHIQDLAKEVFQELGKREAFKPGALKQLLRDSTGFSLYEQVRTLLQRQSGRPGAEGYDETAKAASEWFREHGIPGLRYLDGVSRPKGEGSHNYVIWDDGRVNVTDKYYQRAMSTEGPRGEIAMRFDPTGKPRTFDIRLFNADKSTFAHESAHFLSWALHDLARSDLATEAIRSDYQGLLSWAGYESPEQRLQESLERTELSSKENLTNEEAKRLKALSAKEEKVSHGWEQFLAEGKAPNEKLRSVFGRFKDWMLKIYNGVQGIQRQYAANYDQELNLTDDVRGIFNRMLAVDDSIRQAHADTGSGEELKEAVDLMSPAERVAYRKALAGSLEKADADVQQRAAELQNSPHIQEERDRLTKQAEAELDKQPVYNAMRYLQNGEHVDADGNVASGRKLPALLLNEKGEAYKLGRKDFVETYGIEAAQAMPRGVFSTKKKGGASADEVAFLLGFDSGQEMVKAMQQAEPRNSVVSKQVQSKLDQTYGPALAHINDAAMSAVHNEDAARATLLELRALAKQVDPAVARRVRNLDVKTLRETASRMVSETKVGDLDPAKYARAERSTALRAAELWGRGDKEQAVEQREARLLNQVLYMEARDRLRELQGAQGRLERFSDDARAKLGKAGPAYRDVHDALLEAVGASDKQGDPGSRLGFDALLTQAQSDANELDFNIDAIRELLANPKPWDSLTVDEAQNVADAATNIRKAAAGRLEVVLNDKRIAKDALLQEMSDTASQRPLSKTAARDQNLQGQDKLAKARRILQNMDAQLLTPEALVSMLDGHDSSGPFRRALLEPETLCRDKKLELTRKFVSKIVEQWRSLPEELRSRTTEKVDVTKELPLPEEVRLRRGEGPVSRPYLWMLALQMGNDGNKQRLLDGYGWTEKQVMDVLNSPDKGLSKPEWDFVQGVWDSLEELYPLVADVHEKETGLKPPKVAATAVETAHGTLHGGYFPARYDPLIEPLGFKQQEQAIAGMFEPAYRRPSVRNGSTKARAVKFDGYVNLDWGVVPSHLTQVIHDIAYRSYVKQTAGLVMDPTFQSIVSTRLGEEYAKQFQPWVQAIANAQADGVPAHVSGANQLLGFIRNRVSVGALGLNVASMMAHFADPALASAGGHVSPADTAVAMAKFFSPWGIEMRRFALENSNELQARSDHTTRELLKELGEIGHPRGGLLKKAGEMMGVMHEAMDKIVTTQTWTARYTQSMREGLRDGMTQEEAHAQSVRDANLLIEKVYPSSDAGKMAAALRRKDFLGTALMFQGFMNKIYGLQRGAVDQAVIAYHHEDGSLGSKVGAVAKAGGTLFAIATAGAAARYFAGHGKEDDENTPEYLTRSILSEYFSAVPVLGTVMEGLISAAITGKPKPISIRSSPVASFVQETTKRLYEMAKSNDVSTDKKVASYLETLFSFATGAPTMQAHRTIDYVRALHSGDAQPRGPLDVASGLIYGQRKLQPGNPMRDVQGLVSGE